MNALDTGAGAPDAGLLPLPADTEAQLAGFTELVPTAIANTESRASLAWLAEEQAALRRVATLVAQGLPPVEIFSAVSDEVAHLFRAAQAGVLRFSREGPAFVFVGVSKTLDVPVGTRWEFQPGMVSAEVYRTGSSARVDAMDWSSARGPAIANAESRSELAASRRRIVAASTRRSVRPPLVLGRLPGAGHDGRSGGQHDRT